MLKIFLLWMAHIAVYLHNYMCAFKSKHVRYCRMKLMARDGIRCFRVIVLSVVLLTCLLFTQTVRNPSILGVIFDPVSIKVFAENNTACIGYGKSSTKDDNKCEKRFPNVLIIGAEKGGTGALLRFLSQHPQVVIKDNEFDELRFFCKNYLKGFEWYKEQMPHSLPGQIVIEKSVDYLMDKTTPKKVFYFNPGIKLVLAVRNPVERALSDYALQRLLFYYLNQPVKELPQVKIGQRFPDFEEIWETYLHVLYDVGLEDWLRYFSLKQIHIVEAQELVHSPVSELKEIEKFLNIDPYFDEQQFYFDRTKGFYCLSEPRFKYMEKCLPEGKGIRHPTVNKTLIQKLKDFFRPHNERFYKLSGKHFSWDD